MFFSFFEKFLGIFSQACPYTVIDIEFQEGINMARGQRKTIEEKISEKENLIESLKIRLKSEQRELEELHKEKREVDMKALHEVLEEANITAVDAADIIRGYLQEREDSVEENE